jgi:hypothetical protein
LTGHERPIIVSALRIALVIFALWVLVIEPTFGAYEQIEQQTSQGNHPGGEGCCDLDQQIPPNLVVAPSWANPHVVDVLAAPLINPVGLTLPFDSLAPAISPATLPAELCMPYPPSALPLRL